MSQICSPITTTITPRNSRRASLLLVVLVALVALTLGTGTYLALMGAEHQAVRRHGKHAQCRALAASGIALAQAFLAKTDVELAQVGGPFANPTNLQSVLVMEGAAPMDRGRFSVLAPTLTDGVYSGWGYGLEDESAKLNVNSLVAAGGGGSPAGSSTAPADDAGPRERLLALPGMLPETADAILDWLDADSSARTNGAEAEYYQGLNPPYTPTNGPLAHLDELLQVRGVTPELLYGLDQNRNFVVDPDELPQGMLVELDNSTGELNRGWSAYLTVDSVESFTLAEGGSRANVNGPNLQTLYSELGKTLSDEQAKFIVLARQYGLQQNQAVGGAGGGNNQSGGGNPQQRQPRRRQRGGQQGGQPGGAAAPVSAATIQLDFQKQPAANVNSLLELIGATIQVAPTDGSPPKTVQSPWKDGGFAEMLKLYDAAFAAAGPRVGGRINVNAAPRAVLRTIPGIDAGTVEQILLRRDGIFDPVAGTHRHAIWLLVESVVDLAKMKELEPYVTSQGNVWSGQAVGYFDAGNDLARLQFVIDRTGPTPAVVRVEDLAPFGRGFSPAAVGAQLDQR